MAGQFSRNENSLDFHESCVTVTQPSSWLQTSRSMETVTSELHNFPDIFEGLTNISGSAASTGSIGLGVKLETAREHDKAKTSWTGSKKP